MKKHSILLSVPVALTLLTGLAWSDAVLAGETLVKEFDGFGTNDTRPFGVNDRSEIQWESEGSRFTIYVFHANGRLAFQAIGARGQKVGTIFVPEGGEYFVSVHANGNWKVRVLDID